MGIWRAWHACDQESPSALTESTATNVLKMMPGIGQDWSFIGTTSALFYGMQIYLAQFESLLVC
jgi:hypothetical protein